MKTLFSILLALLIPTVSPARERDLQKHLKQKTIKKAYIVNPDAGIDITNAYGNVYVTTWAEDKIELDIQIKVSSDKEDWAIKKLNDINVDITALKHLVTAKTTFANGAGKVNTRNNSIEVNYTIKIPAAGGVTIDNKYGQILSTDLAGPTNIKCKYGKILLGKLHSASNTIDIEYCSKSSIEYAKTARIEADYSGISMNDFGTIALNADYTDVNFRNGGQLKYNCSYGSVKIGNIVNLEGSGDYLSVAVETVSGQFNVNTNYSKILIDQVSAKAGNIVVNADYTTVHIGYNPGYAFDFDVRIKYANFKYSDLEVAHKNETATSKNYSGHYKKQGINKISVVSAYGNVHLNKTNP